MFIYLFSILLGLAGANAMPCATPLTEPMRETLARLVSNNPIAAFELMSANLIAKYEFPAAERTYLTELGLLDEAGQIKPEHRADVAYWADALDARVNGRPEPAYPEAAEVASVVASEPPPAAEPVSAPTPPKRKRKPRQPRSQSATQPKPKTSRTKPTRP